LVQQTRKYEQSSVTVRILKILANCDIEEQPTTLPIDASFNSLENEPWFVAFGPVDATPTESKTSAYCEKFSSSKTSQKCDFDACKASASSPMASNRRAVSIIVDKP